jgi:hypothetical protein
LYLTKTPAGFVSVPLSLAADLGYAPSSRPRLKIALPYWPRASEEAALPYPTKRIAGGLPIL